MNPPVKGKPASERRKTVIATSAPVCRATAQAIGMTISPGRIYFTSSSTESAYFCTPARRTRSMSAMNSP